MVVGQHRQRQDRVVHPAGAAARRCRARRHHQAPREGHDLRPAHPRADADARTGDAGRQGARPSTAATCRACASRPSSAACRIRRRCDALRGPLDILISTPGRLLDHLQTGKAVLEQRRDAACSTKPIACSTWASSTTSTTIADHLPTARQTRDVQRHLRRPRRPPRAEPAARSAARRRRLAHRHARQHRAAPALGRQLRRTRTRCSTTS